MPDAPLSRREVGRTLKALRNESGLSQAAAAALTAGPEGKLVVDQTLISKYERGEVVPSARSLAALLAHYGPDDKTRRDLEASVGEHVPSGRRVVVDYSGAPRRQREYREIEDQAVRVTTFQPTIVPGLLQTDRYALALVGGAFNGPVLEQWREARRARRAALDDPQGRQFVQIVTSGALEWRLGDDGIMRDQFDHLAALVDHPALRLGVVPPGAGSDMHVLHGFTLYDMPDGSRRLIYGMHARGVASFDDTTDPAQIAFHLDLLARLEPLAAWDAAALPVLAELRTLYETDENQP